METISRFLVQPRGSFFLFGPRGTGKSTWVRQSLPDALRIDLLAPDLFRSYSARPEHLREVVLGNPGKRAVVIDEVQKLPVLLDVVHALIEERPERRFVLTGSSARKLKCSGVDLLAGRAVVRTMHPFMAAELGEKFSLTDALSRGLLPVVLASEQPDDVLRSYVALYLREEVQLEGMVRNIGNFSRFLEAVSFSHAAPLNVSGVSRDCEIERKTVEGYVGILEDLLLAYRLPVFTKRAKRATAAHPKMYLFDAGVFRSLRPRGPLDRSEEIGGAALEGLIAQHLTAWNAYRGEPAKLSYWRTASGREIDFILDGAEGLWAIEVKNSRRVRPEDLHPLLAFREDYPQCRTLLLYRGTERYSTRDILCIPCEEFLVNLHPLRDLNDICKTPRS